MSFETLLYDAAGPIATITLNRPDRLNTIVPPMPDEFEAAIARGDRRPERQGDRAPRRRPLVLRRLRLRRRLSPLGRGAHHRRAWDPGKDFARPPRRYGPTQKFMSMWRTPKPVIAQVHGWCVGGGSDMALCADLIIASEDAQIGTPYSRMWGCYLSGMWLYRLGLTKAKEHALTGKPLSGREAAEIELINAAVPFDQLEPRSPSRPSSWRTIPSSQLAAMKLIVNQAYENMGLRLTQTLGPILDGLMRNTPAAHAFIETGRAEGVRAATSGRDAPFGDYSAAGPDGRPDPGHVITPRPA